jgi:hypothetical protein
MLTSPSDPGDMSMARPAPKAIGHVFIHCCRRGGKLNLAGPAVQPAGDRRVSTEVRCLYLGLTDAVQT